MPMPKPENPEDIRIGASGTKSESGVVPKTLDIKVVKPFEADIPDIASRMAELAAAKKTADAGS